MRYKTCRAVRLWGFSSAMVRLQHKQFVPTPCKLKWNLHPCCPIYFYEGKGLRWPFSQNEVLPSQLFLRVQPVSHNIRPYFNSFQWHPCKLYSSAPKAVAISINGSAAMYRYIVKMPFLRPLSSHRFRCLSLFLMFLTLLINSQPAAILVSEKRIKSRK